MFSHREDARIEKTTGEIVGPYKAFFTGTTIIIDDNLADVEEGDVVLRRLPNGKDERSVVTQATFHPRGIGGFGQHYQLKFTKGGQAAPKPVTQTININAHNVQMGDHNIQHVVHAFQSLVEQIDKVDADPKDKEEAKSRLQSFLKHPLVNTLLGTAAGAIL